MADAQSDADKVGESLNSHKPRKLTVSEIRQRRLAKLGVPSPAAPSEGQQNGETSSSAQQQPKTEPVISQANIRAEDTRPEQTSVSSAAVQDTPKPATPQPTSSPAPQITIKPQPPLDGQSDAVARPRSRQGRVDTIESWEDRTLSGIFRITLNEEQKERGQVYYLPGVKSDLEDEGASLRISLAVLDQAILEAASRTRNGKPLEYLLGCWKRVSKLWRGMRSGSENDPKYHILKETRRLCMSYCIFAVTMPDMFGVEPNDRNPLAEHLLCDPDNDNGVCHDFLQEAVGRFPDDDSIKDALVSTIEQLSRDLSKMTMNDNYKPYIMALRNCVRHRPLVDALTQSSMFLPENVEAPQIETDTLLGPFFRISPLTADVALQYFTGASGRDEAFVRNSQHALRMTLQTHQDDLFDIAERIIKADKATRERMLDWFALAVNKNHKRRATYVDDKLVSSDGFMINVTAVMDRFCEPFAEPTFSKVHLANVEYFRREPRVDISDETKINADQKMSDEFYANKLGPRNNNFITEIFFLTVAAHHYGKEAANTKLENLKRNVKHLEKQIEQMEKERHRFIGNNQQLALFDEHVKRYKDQLEKARCVIRAVQGVLADETAQQRSMQFMRFVIVWLLRVAVPETAYPKEEIRLPLAEDVPQVFKCLPEFLLYDIVDNFKFCTREMPWTIMPTQCEELITICITFLRSSEYIKSPYLKSGLVSILFHGVWPFRGRPKGILGDLLNSSKFALKHLLHALMKFYIEAESTGTHTQFFDKFNIRYEIFKVIQCIWSNSIYRDNLGRESKQNVDFFVRFVNLMLNDVTFVLDESFSAFRSIHKLQDELRAEDSQMTQEQRQQKEEELEGAKGRAKSYMQLTNETVAMFKMFTEALPDAFTMPEIVQRLADMLDYNLDAMAGKNQRELKVEDPQQYGFAPVVLLSDIMSVYLNLKDKPSFHLAVARDGRSYKPYAFANAVNIMNRTGASLKSPDELDTWVKLTATIAATKEADDQAEEDLGEIPDEFLDPLMYTLMEDPVILPMSKQTVDRSTIRSHLLSDPTDPFNRQPMSIDDVIENTELKTQIVAFKAEARERRIKVIEESKAAELAEAAQDVGDPMDVDSVAGQSLKRKSPDAI